MSWLQRQPLTLRDRLVREALDAGARGNGVAERRAIDDVSRIDFARQLRRQADAIEVETQRRADDR